MKQDRLKKSVYLFDFDGTLVDSMGTFADLAARLISQSFRTDPAKAREDYLRTSGLPFFLQLEDLFPKHPLNSEVARRFELEKQDTYWEAPFFKEAPAVLRSLREAGIRTAVSSNNGQEIVEQYLAKRGAADCFDLVLGFRPGFSKGREHFEAVIRHFGVETSEILFVGDSLHDAAKAKEFGLDFVGRLGTFSRERFEQEFPELIVVENFQQLGAWICR